MNILLTIKQHIYTNLHIYIYIYIYIYNKLTACVAQWLRRQTHKQ